MKDSKIAWTMHTFNPWVGCAHMSPGCENCYAEAQNNRFKWNGGAWGHGAPRKITGNANWRNPVKWNAGAARAGRRDRVFCASLADVFDSEAPPEARERLWKLIRATPHLDWLILTKRPQNFKRFLPTDWANGYPNVWLGVTVENRKNGFPRVVVLRNTPAKVRFLSCEPLLEDVSDVDLTDIDWVIIGGESGAGSRAFDLAWARKLKAHCEAAAVAIFVKQLGSHPIEKEMLYEIEQKQPNGKRDTHGTALENFPPDLRVRKLPREASQVHTQVRDASQSVPPDALQEVLGWLLQVMNTTKRSDITRYSLAMSAFASLNGLTGVLDRLHRAAKMMAA